MDFSSFFFLFYFYFLFFLFCFSCKILGAFVRTSAISVCMCVRASVDFISFLSKKISKSIRIVCIHTTFVWAREYIESADEMRTSEPRAKQNINIQHRKTVEKKKNNCGKAFCIYIQSTTQHSIHQTFTHTDIQTHSHTEKMNIYRW